MEITVNRVDLIHALSVAEAASKPDDTYPIPGYVYCAVKGNSADVFGYNVGHYVKHTVPVKNIGVNGRFPLPVTAQALSYLKNEQVVLQTQGDRVKLKYPGGSMSFAVTGIENNHLSISPDLEPAFRIRQKNLRDALAKVSHAIATSELNSTVYDGTLQGVLFEGKGDNVNIVASDGYRLTCVSLDTIPSKAFRITIPAFSLPVLMQVLQNLTEVGANKVTVMTNEKTIVFIVDNTQVVIKFMSGEFPDYHSIIPTQPTTTIKLPLREITEAVERAVFTRSPFVKIATADNITLSTKGEIKFQDEVPAVCNGGPVEIHLNPEYLLNALEAFEGNNITIHFNTGKDPIMLTTPGITEVIMPIQV